MTGFASIGVSPRPETRRARPTPAHAAPMGGGGFSSIGIRRPRDLAAMGQGADNAARGGMVAHITADEARKLKRGGGAGTINPATGLPQFAPGDIIGYKPGEGYIRDDGSGSAATPSPEDSYQPESPRQSASLSGDGSISPRAPWAAGTTINPTERERKAGENAAAMWPDLRDSFVDATADQPRTTAEDLLGSEDRSQSTGRVPSGSPRASASMPSASRGRTETVDRTPTQTRTPGDTTPDTARLERVQAGAFGPSAGTSAFSKIGTQDSPGPTVGRANHPPTKSPAQPQSDIPAPTGPAALTAEQRAQIHQAQAGGTWLGTDLVSQMTPADYVEFYRAYGYFPHVRIDGGLYQVEQAPPGVVAGIQNMILGNPAEPQNVGRMQQLANLSGSQLSSLALSKGGHAGSIASALDGISGYKITVPIYAGTSNSGLGRSEGYQGFREYTHMPQPGMSVVVGRTGNIVEIPITALDGNPGLRDQVQAMLDAGQTSGFPGGGVFYSTHPADLAARGVQGFEQFAQPANGMFDPSMTIFDDRLPTDYYTNAASPGYERTAPGAGTSQAMIDSTPEMITPVGASFQLFRHKDGTVVDSEGWVMKPVTLGNGQPGYLDTYYGVYRQQGSGIIVDQAGNPIMSAYGPTNDPLKIYGSDPWKGAIGRDTPRNGEGPAAPYSVGPGLTPTTPPVFQGTPSTLPGLQSPGTGPGGSNNPLPVPGSGGGQSPPPSTTPAPSGSGAPINVQTIYSPSQRRRFASGFNSIGL